MNLEPDEVKPIESVTIIINDSLIPSLGLSAEELNQAFDDDSYRIFESLKSSLPGGTFQKLAERMSNHFAAKAV